MYSIHFPCLYSSEIDQLLSRIADDSELIDYSLQQLRDLWVMVASQSSVRREKIHELDSELQKVEDSRMDQVVTHDFILFSLFHLVYLFVAIHFIYIYTKQ